MKKFIRFAALFPTALLIIAAAPVNENDNGGDEGKNISHLPLPRFASLRSDEVNMRAGPGTRYPIEWVLTREAMPVEITEEYEVWRHVRDPSGDEGWVHRNGLSGKRMVIVTGVHDLHDNPDDASSVVAHLEDGAMGQLLSCKKEWCRLKFEGIKGYLPKSEFWGAYPGEVFN